MDRNGMNSCPSCIRSDGWARRAISSMPCCISKAPPSSRARSCTSTADRAPATREGITAMPIVTIQVTREGSASGAASVTAEQKAALIKGASQLLLDVLNKPPEATFVVIEEVEMENWGWGGLPVAEYRKKLRAAS